MIKFINILNCINSSYIFFCPKTFQYPQIICYRHTRKAFLSLLVLPNFISKNWFYYIFSLLPACNQLHHLVGYHVTGINSLFISLLNALHCLGLLCQGMTWINVDTIFHIIFLACILYIPKIFKYKIFQQMSCIRFALSWVILTISIVLEHNIVKSRLPIQTELW